MQNRLKKISLLFVLLALAVIAFGGSGRAAPVFGYLWPFGDRDLKTELGSQPVVMELFTTQACMYCPMADQFFNDLMDRTDNIIGLSCHIDSFDVQKGSIALPFCTERQTQYSETITKNAYTPQIIINGRIAEIGYKYNDIIKHIKEQSKIQLQPIELPSTSKIELPAIKLPANDMFHVYMVYYRKDKIIKVADGANAGQKFTYRRTVSHAEDLGEWDGKAITLTAAEKFKADDAGVVLLVENKNHNIVAFGKLENKTPKAGSAG